MAEATIQQQIKQEYDCVVIGAGNGGLGAAARLAAAGAPQTDNSATSTPVHPTP